MEVSTMWVWFIVGVSFFAIELLIVNGVGFLFAGFGALTVGAALNLSLIASDDLLLQALLFLISTALWTAVLWKPVQKFAGSKGQKGKDLMLGQIGVVAEGGVTKDGGNVKWSGTVMKARLASNSHIEKLEAGAQVTIQEVSGITLTVAPK